MRRTQIYLDTQTIRLLTKLSSKTKKSRSELIREAINSSYEKAGVKEIVSRALLNKSFASGNSSESDESDTVQNNSQNNSKVSRIQRQWF